jgi:hypothetical protein
MVDSACIHSPEIMKECLRYLSGWDKRFGVLWFLYERLGMVRLRYENQCIQVEFHTPKERHTPHILDFTTLTITVPRSPFLSLSLNTRLKIFPEALFGISSINSTSSTPLYFTFFSLT